MRSLIFFAFLGLALANPTTDLQLGSYSSKMVKTIVDNYEQLSPLGRIDLINDFIDAALTEVRSVLTEQGIDPLNAPDIHEKISYKLIIITYYGELNLTKGLVEGVSSIVRNGDVKLDYTNRVLSMDVPVVFENFILSYDYKAVIMGLGPGGGVEGKTKNVKLRIVIDLDFKTMQLNMKKFDIVKIGAITVKFSGNILIDWLINLLNNTVIFLFKGIITWVMEWIVRDTIKDLIEEVNKLLANLVPGGGSESSFNMLQYNSLL